MPHPGLEPGPSDPESSALTTGPLTPHLKTDRAKVLSERWQKTRSFVYYLYKMANSDSTSTDEFENPKVENAEKAKCKVREIFGDETPRPSKVSKLNFR